MRPRQIVLLVVAGLLLALVVGPVAMARADAVEPFLNRVEVMLRSQPPDCALLLAQAVDVAAVAGQIQRAVPELAGEPVRPALIGAVTRRLTRECLSITRDKIAAGISIVEARRGVSGQVVTTRGRTDQQGTGPTLVWRLTEGGPWGWRIVDLRAEGRGLVATLIGDAKAALAIAPGDRDAALRAMAR